MKVSIVIRYGKLRQKYKKKNYKHFDTEDIEKIENNIFFIMLKTV